MYSSRNGDSFSLSGVFTHMHFRACVMPLAIALARSLDVPCAPRPGRSVGVGHLGDATDVYAVIWRWPKNMPKTATLLQLCHFHHGRMYIPGDFGQTTQVIDQFVRENLEPNIMFPGNDVNDGIDGF